MIKTLALAAACLWSSLSWALDPLSLPRLNGSGPVTENHFSGKTTLVQFWASWCKSCSGEVIKAAALAKELNVPFLAISEDEDLASARSVLKKIESSAHDLFERSALDSQSAFAKRIAVEGVPATALIGPDVKPILAFKGHATPEQVKQLKEAVAAQGPAKATTP